MTTVVDRRSRIHCPRCPSNNTVMPTISRFYGLTIRMYYDDHAPPHFHVYYGESQATIEIDHLRVNAGQLPRRALALALEWANVHHDELVENWFRAVRHETLKVIDPLD